MSETSWTPHQVRGQLKERVMHLAARDDATPLLIMAVQSWIEEAVADWENGTPAASKNPYAPDEPPVDLEQCPCGCDIPMGADAYENELVPPFESIREHEPEPEDA